MFPGAHGPQNGVSLATPHGMRILHRDSDVVGAIVLLVILLLTGIRALVM
jgi:hypothetical protein